MYKTVYLLLTENNIIYDFWISFRQNVSAAHALINLTGNIRQALDEKYIGYEIFFQQNLITIVFQKTGLDLIFPFGSNRFL